MPEDKRRDQVVDSYNRLVKVLCRDLKLSKDRIMVNLSLEQLGVNDSNRAQIQESLSKELNVDVPYDILKGRNTVGGLASYIAHQKNNDIPLKPNQDNALKPKEDIANPKKSAKSEPESKEKKEVEKDAK